MRKMSVAMVVLFIGMVLGCVYRSDRPTFAERLNLQWAAGQQWKVRTTLWPSRVRSPAIRGDTPVHRSWRYHVSHPVNPGKQTGKLRVESEQERYMVELSTMFSVKAVKELRPSSTPGILKTRWIGRNSSWGDGAPFYPSVGRSSLDNIWFFPALNGRGFSQWERYTILSSQQSTGRWIEQKAVPVENGIRFVLRNRSRTERIKLTWLRNQPWWSKAVWTFHGRVVGTAKLVSPRSQPKS